MPPSVTSLISRDAPRVGPALIPLEYRTMMRPLTYLPVIDFIISFISSSRDFHASPSLLKTGPLLLAAPCPRPWPLIPFQISSRSPPRRPRARRTCSPRWRPWSPGRRLRSRAGRTRGTGRHRASRPPRRRGRRHGATPGTAARLGVRLLPGPLVPGCAGVPCYPPASSRTRASRP